jgi:ribonuclease P protein component
MSASTPRLRLGASQRLRTKRDFETVYGDSRRFDDRFFGLRVRVNKAKQARIGLAVAVKVAGNAVRRNRIRRLIRETFRLAQHELPPVDVVVTAKIPAREAPAPALRASLAGLWQRVATACAPSSKS